MAVWPDLQKLHPLVGRCVAKLCRGMLADGKYSFVAVWMCPDLALVIVVTAHAMQIFVKRLPPPPPTILLLMVIEQGQCLASCSRAVRRGVDRVVGQDEEEWVPGTHSLAYAVQLPTHPLLFWQGQCSRQSVSPLRAPQMCEWDSVRDVGHGEGIAGK